MSLFAGTFDRLARHARWVLIAGLLAGIFVPGLAGFTKPWLGHLVFVLLFLAALRVRPDSTGLDRADGRKIAGFILIFQIAIPSIFAAMLLGLNFTPYLAVAVLLALSSAPISASPSLTLISGHDPAPSLRLLIATTALLPATILLPFWILPVFGNPVEVAWVAAKLFAIIFSASGLAMLVRRWAGPGFFQNQAQAIDGLTAVTMACIVTGLMSGFLDAAVNAPQRILLTLAIAFGLNLGMQVLCWVMMGRLKIMKGRVAYSIAAGNRNLAIFLAALPAALTDPMLLFIACYQLPMYLTPTLLGPLYRRSDEDKAKIID